MTRTILGLDVGGANLKAATPDGRAASVPFALWKQPDRLPAALAELVGRFPDAAELAVTMTGELCDCYETKRQGVNAILDAVEFAAAGRPVWVWGTGGGFLSVATSRVEYLTVAAANWHALGMFVGRVVPNALLIDIGSTTSDLTPLADGVPMTYGQTDADRLAHSELVYTGVRRTPVCALMASWPRVAAELFATSLDVYLTLGQIADDPADRNTADGRPATAALAHARLSRMLGGDPVQTDQDDTCRLAEVFASRQVELLAESVDAVRSSFSTIRFETAVLAGVGEFLGRQVLASTQSDPITRIVSLTDRLGPAVSASAPAHAVAVLASERPL